MDGTGVPVQAASVAQPFAHVRLGRGFTFCTVGAGMLSSPGEGGVV